MALYVSVAEFREAVPGFTEAVAADDEVTAKLTLAQAFIERATGQWFEVRGPYTFRLDGNGSDTLHFAIPIVEVTALKINDSETALDEDAYCVYNRRGEPIDDRKNPRIVLRRDVPDIYSPAYGSGGRFLAGRQNQEITGTFGYVEADDTTPKLIKRALIKLTAEKIGRPIAGPSVGPALPSLIGGIIAEEKTDGHSVKYAVPPVSARRPGLSGFTADQEIHDILRLFKRPMGVAVPVDFHH